VVLVNYLENARHTPDALWTNFLGCRRAFSPGRWRERGILSLHISPAPSLPVLSLLGHNSCVKRGMSCNKLWARKKMWSCALKLKQLRKHYNTTGKKEKEKKRGKKREWLKPCTWVSFWKSSDLWWWDVVWGTSLWQPFDFQIARKNLMSSRKIKCDEAAFCILICLF